MRIKLSLQTGEPKQEICPLFSSEIICYILMHRIEDKRSGFVKDRIGQQCGNYRLERLLGKGGFAEVYLGEHIFLGTSAAIKLLHQGHMSPEEQQAFLTEARTVAKLTHRHIIRLLDFGFQDEMPFLVMDYASGGTLRSAHARGTRLSLEKASEYARQVAEALQFAHDQHLIHRDIKPENMLLGDQNEVLVGDFGIALAVQNSRAQRTQDVIGTVQYMSPEQILGKPHLASDQYALAIVVYEWLSGAVPFRGSFTEVCAQHMHAPLPDLRTLRPDLPSEVAQVLAIALAKKPEERFTNIRAFATALGEIGRQTVRSSSRPSIEPTVAARPPIAPTVAARPFPNTPITTPPVITNEILGQTSGRMMAQTDPSSPPTMASKQSQSPANRGAMALLMIGVGAFIGAMMGYSTNHALTGAILGAGTLFLITAGGRKRSNR
jgi:serine/threonine protein kinase